MIFLLAACGTTTQTTSMSNAPGGGLAPPPSAAGVGVTTPGAATPSTQQSAGPVAPAAVAAAGGSDAPYVPGEPAGSADVRDALSGLPGITPRTVKIGFETAGNAAALRAAFGLPDPQAPAIQDALRIIFNYVNKHGGFGGRKGEFMIHETDISEGNFETEAQAACSAFTEDAHVFAAVSAVSRTPTIFDCLAKHRTLGFAYYPGLAIPLSTWDGDGAYVYGPVYVAHPRSNFLVDTWVHMGLLNPSSKIGIISIDDPTHQAFAQAVRDGLRRHGMKVTDEYKASPAEQLSDLGRAGEQMNNAVLQFRTHNVDVVLFANTAGGGPALFMPAAENQHYQPKYGVSSYEFLETAVALAPEAALERSVGPGWLPDFDLTDPKYLPKNPERDKCIKMFRDGGLTVNGNTEMSIGELCQVVYLIRDGMNAVSLRQAASIRAGLEGLGRYPNANADPLMFSPGRRHDAIGEYREMRFRKDCGCFYYTTGALPIPG
jgi:ABC-type branched-subunit amino acid transport system substrate-binding protein